MKHREPNWVGVVVLVVSVVLLVAAFQFRLDQRDQTARDRTDRDYANCLTKFAGDLVRTIQTRTDAAAKVTTAERRRDKAVDDVLDVVSRARQTPPGAGESDFDKALTGAIVARNRLDVVQREADKVRDLNQYVLPQAVCSR